MIQVEDEAAIADSVKLHHPRTVIRNLPPDHPGGDRLTLPVPVIECSLPSQSWVAGRLAVAPA